VRVATLSKNPRVFSFESFKHIARLTRKPFAPPSAENRCAVVRPQPCVSRRIMTYVPPHRRYNRAGIPSDSYVPPRQRDGPIKDFVDSLENKVIEATASYPGQCPTCNSPYWGVLDQKKASEYGIPLGPKWKVVHNYRDYIYRRGVHRPPGKEQFITILPSPYEVRMQIVRSGLFTREQLRQGLFNQHELEISERAFRSIRPRVCDCSYGEPSDDAMAAFLAEAGLDPSFLEEDHPLETEVETAFLAGVPVRTGFRRRSPESRVRRAVRRKQRLLEKNLSPKIPTKPVDVGAMAPPGKAKKRRQPRTARQMARKARRPYRKTYVSALPCHSGRFNKYWYFLRTRGRVYLSIHNPIRGQWDLPTFTGPWSTRVHVTYTV